MDPDHFTRTGPVAEAASQASRPEAATSRFVHAARGNMVRGFHSLRRAAPVALPLLVVLYAATLHLDAITQRYGPVVRPRWLHALQVRSQAPLRMIRPDAFRWDPEPAYPHRDGPPTKYYSDPYTYLQFAREMPSFYAAHYREPLYPFATKVSLRLFRNQDVAVSFVSAFFSVLAVAATYLLGAVAFSRRAGFVAALALAVEYEVVSLGASGWRDPAFMFSVVMFALAGIRYFRRPSNATSVFLGFSAAVACLLRITALSFVVPAFGVLLIAGSASWKQRLRDLSVATLVLATLTGPYLFNCWRVFGDPLYAINYHTRNYLAVEGRTVEARPTAAAYVENKLFDGRFRTVDTIALGLTSYPFSNKWAGFDPWLRGLGTWLSWASLAGLFLFVGGAHGRLLLVVLGSSLVPYAVTWRLIGDWRFTEHAYPFFLLAAAFAITRVAALATPSSLRALKQWRRPARSRVLFWAVAVVTVAACALVVQTILPVAIVRETLAAGEDVSITAGERDTQFFGDGWSRPVREVLPARIARGIHSVIWIPLPRAADYGLTLRLNPYPPPAGPGAPLPVVRVALNGTPVQTLRLGWNPERVGTYDVPLPRTLVKQGFNQLELRATNALGAPVAAGGGFSLWYARVHPPAR